MVHVVRHDSPNCPLSRNFVIRTTETVRISLEQIIRSPLVQHAVDWLPGKCEPLRKSRGLIGWNCIFHDVTSAVAVSKPAWNPRDNHINSRRRDAGKPCDSSQTNMA